MPQTGADCKKNQLRSILVMRDGIAGGNDSILRFRLPMPFRLQNG
ncbi:hypothetical protein [Beggiatoa leptomitoformis]|nr:hypothetical protein [Beggiatoa leptomitoformis]